METPETLFLYQMHTSENSSQNSPRIFAHCKWDTLQVSRPEVKERCMYCFLVFPDSIRGLLKVFSNRFNSESDLKNGPNWVPVLSGQGGEPRPTDLTWSLFMWETLKTETHFQYWASTKGIPLVLTSLGIGKEEGTLRWQNIGFQYYTKHNWGTQIQAPDNQHATHCKKWTKHKRPPV